MASMNGKTEKYRQGGGGAKPMLRSLQAVTLLLHSLEVLIGKHDRWAFIIGGTQTKIFLQGLSQMLLWTATQSTGREKREGQKSLKKKRGRLQIKKRVCRGKQGNFFQEKRMKGEINRP